MEEFEVDYKKISERIRAIRKKLGWQQMELTARAGLTTSHMSHIENGKTKLALHYTMRRCSFTACILSSAVCQNV